MKRGRSTFYGPDLESNPGFATYQQQGSGRVNLLSFFDREMERIMSALADCRGRGTAVCSLPPC